ncbi:MAG: hypothetical protein PVF43_00155 [Candidatus Eiseniibacteriota bacterium]
MPLLVALVAASGLAGCGSHALDLARVREELVAGNLEAAADELDKRDGGDKDLLSLLERAHMHHLTGDWAESNRLFEAAEERADELYTRSISRNAASIATSDNILPYRGTGYELELVHYYRAFNYLALGQPDGALVEARKASELLARQAPENPDDDSAAAAEQRGFMNYVMGLLFAAYGETNDAIVSLRNAYQLYVRAAGGRHEGAPPGLVAAYHAAASHLGLGEEVVALERHHPELAAREERAPADVAVFFETGFAPYREPVDIFLPIFEDDDDDDEAWVRAPHYVDRYRSSIYSYTHRPRHLDRVLRFSFPRLVDVPSSSGGCELELPDGRIVPASTVLDLQAVAHDAFKDALPGILLRTVVRAITKEVARSRVRKENEVLGVLVNAVNVATEQADTRCWLLLPRRIALAEVDLPGGIESVVARCRDRGGTVLDEWSVPVGTGSGRTRFETLRSFH